MELVLLLSRDKDEDCWIQGYIDDSQGSNGTHDVSGFYIWTLE